MSKLFDDVQSAASREQGGQLKQALEEAMKATVADGADASSEASDDAAEQVAVMLRDAVLDGIALKDVYGVSEEMMEGLYAHAHDFYSNGQLDEAEKFFRFLCLYDFYNIDYIMGLAAVSQMKKLYAKAIGLYAVAFGMGKNDYRPMFFTGQCHLFERKAAKARQCFEIVVAHSTDPALVLKSQAYVGVLARSGATDAQKDPASDTGNAAAPAPA